MFFRVYVARMNRSRRWCVAVLCLLLTGSAVYTMLYFKGVSENVRINKSFNEVVHDISVSIDKHYVSHIPFRRTNFNRNNILSRMMDMDFQRVHINMRSGSSPMLADGRKEPSLGGKGESEYSENINLEHEVWYKKVVKEVQEIKDKYPYVMLNWDLSKTKLISTLSNFKSPCWYENQPIRSNCTYRHFTPTRTSSTRTLRCLPYFYIVGLAKCATSDIYRSLSRHPQVAATPKKEGNWLNRIRLMYPECSGLNTYLDFFKTAAREIESHFTWATKHGGERQKYHDMVTVDATTSLMVDNCYWRELPGNENCSTACETQADSVHHLNPSAKILLSLRNPVDRLYSHYLFGHFRLKYKPTPDDFHRHVLYVIDAFENCMKRFSLRYCVYNCDHDNQNSHVKLKVGMYYVHLNDWLRVFPRDQIHVVRFEDYINDKAKELRSIFEFLQLRPLNHKEIENILKMPVVNTRPMSKYGTLKDPMNSNTREILEEFYKPFNEELAKLMNDSKYKYIKIN